MATTHKISPEQINKQSGGTGYRLYRVFEVHGPSKFSMLFNTKSDAEAVCDWHNETSLTWWDKLHNYSFKVRERRVHSGIRHVVTTRSEGYPELLGGVKQGK
jgi:hypothetical protein